MNRFRIAFSEMRLNISNITTEAAHSADKQRSLGAIGVILKTSPPKYISVSWIKATAVIIIMNGLFFVKFARKNILSERDKNE